MKKKTIAVVSAVLLIIGIMLAGFSAQHAANTSIKYTYTCSDYSFERNGIKIHLDCMKADGAEQKSKSFLRTALPIHLTNLT